MKGVHLTTFCMQQRVRLYSTIVCSSTYFVIIYKATVTSARAVRACPGPVDLGYKVKTYSETTTTMTLYTLLRRTNEYDVFCFVIFHCVVFSLRNPATRDVPNGPAGAAGPEAQQDHRKDPTFVWPTHESSAAVAAEQSAYG